VVFIVPVKIDIGLDGVVTEPPKPLMMLHCPIPTVGEFAAKVIVVPSQTVWSVPAAAVVGIPETVKTPLSLFQIPLIPPYL